jgi:hypothetical protein
LPRQTQLSAALVKDVMANEDPGSLRIWELIYEALGITWQIVTKRPAGDEVTNSELEEARDEAEATEATTKNALHKMGGDIFFAGRTVAEVAADRDRRRKHDPIGTALGGWVEDLDERLAEAVERPC